MILITALFQFARNQIQIISKLNQIVNAGYVNYLYNFGEKLEVNTGVRIENSDRTII
jgi:hypothetical protein